MKQVQPVKGSLTLSKFWKKLSPQKDLKVTIIGGDGHDAEVVQQEVANRNLISMSIADIFDQN